MITMRHIERQFGIPVAPTDNQLRLSLYLKTAGTTPSERRQKLGRELHNQHRKVLALHPTRGQESLVNEIFERLQARLNVLDLPEKAEGVGAFADTKQLLVYVLPRLGTSFVAASNTFHIRPLLRVPEFFSRYTIVTLHGGHAAGYLRSGNALRKIFSFTPEPTLDESANRSEKKRIKSSQTMDHALEKIAELGDISLCVFGPRYLRARFRKLLAKQHLRPPVFEADADSTLEDLVIRADRTIGDSPEAAAGRLREQITAAERSGLIINKMSEIITAAATGAVDSLVITSTDSLWSDAVWPLLRSSASAATILPWSEQQLSLTDDCLLDDLGETVLRGGGKVAELPLFKSFGSPAFAILRWRLNSTATQHELRLTKMPHHA